MITLPEIEGQIRDAKHALDALLALPPDAPAWEREVYVDRLRAALDTLSGWAGYWTDHQGHP